MALDFEVAAGGGHRQLRFVVRPASHWTRLLQEKSSIDVALLTFPGLRNELPSEQQNEFGICLGRPKRLVQAGASPELNASTFIRAEVKVLSGDLDPAKVWSLFRRALIALARDTPEELSLE